MDRYAQYPPNNKQNNDANLYRPPDANLYRPPDANLYRPPTSNFQSNQTSNAVVITDGPKPTVGVNFGPNSQPLICPHCHCSITSQVENKANTKTHIAAFLLCGCCCCCWPYCMNSCQAQNHYCPQCNAFLGSYN